MGNRAIQHLKQEHSTESIRQRLQLPQKHSYLADAILGGIDGCITTFAIVASAVGAGLPNAVALILGLANLVADGFSMAASNYQASKSRADRLHKTRQDEELHIALFPEGEKEEIRQIFAAKGFEGNTLETIVSTITSDRTLWVNTMLQDEHGLQLTVPSPIRAGLTTFLSFLFIGFLPLLPFLLPITHAAIFPTSCIIAALVFFGIGLTKGMVLRLPCWRSGLSTLTIGSIAAALAYLVGTLSEQWLNGVGL